jgi:hypothetical protein
VSDLYAIGKIEMEAQNLSVVSSKESLGTDSYIYIPTYLHTYIPTLLTYGSRVLWRLVWR